MTWTDNRGKRMRTWIPNEVGAIPDPQEFMDTLVDRAVGILKQEPVDIYVNPTYLPDVTAERLRIALDRTAAEEGDRRPGEKRRGDGNQRPLQAARAPRSSKWPRRAASNSPSAPTTPPPTDLRRCEYGLQMVKECKLGWQDFFVPGKAPKAVDRKGSILKS